MPSSLSCGLLSIQSAQREALAPQNVKHMHWKAIGVNCNERPCKPAGEPEALYP